MILRLILRPVALAGGLFAASLVAGCAVSTGHDIRFDHDNQRISSQSADPVWQGRLSVRIPASPEQGVDQDQQWSSGFVLQGTPDRGRLQLLTPLGTTTADIVWTPIQAVLRANNESRRFDNIDALVGDVLGAPVPIAALLAWLDGVDRPIDGWTVDLTGYADGKMTARRDTAPQAWIRIVLDR